MYRLDQDLLSVTCTSYTSLVHVSENLLICWYFLLSHLDSLMSSWLVRDHLIPFWIPFTNTVACICDMLGSCFSSKRLLTCLVLMSSFPSFGDSLLVCVVVMWWFHLHWIGASVFFANMFNYAQIECNLTKISDGSSFSSDCLGHRDCMAGVCQWVC